MSSKYGPAACEEYFVLKGTFKVPKSLNTETRFVSYNNDEIRWGPLEDAAFFEDEETALIFGTSHKIAILCENDPKTLLKKKSVRVCQINVASGKRLIDNLIPQNL